MAIDNESMADELGQKIAQALRDKAAWRRLPRGSWRKKDAGCCWWRSTI